MSAYSLSADTNIDALTSKAGGDTYDTNGWILTIDQDSRVGLNQTTSASLGAMTVNATKGGKINIDGRYVRLIPYNGGSGTVPAWNTSITQGGASGKLIGVYASLTSASTATGAAMPASGYIKIKQWNGTPYAAGALSGITATATGADVVGWLEIIGDEAATINANRLGEVNITGAWYSLGVTSGSANQTVQIPNNGLLRYVAGVFIEKTQGQADYEFYANAGTAITIGTEAQRGKVVWIDNTGLVRIGNNGSGAMGYTPAANLAIVVPNIFLENCTTAARTANVIPNATIATRFDFTCTGGGVVNIDKCNSAWYLSFAQPYSVSLSNTGTIDGLLLQECATAINWSKVGVGNKPTTALVMSGLTMTLCFAGGTCTDCVWTIVSQGSSGNHTVTLTDISGFTFVRDTIRANTIRGNATTYSINATRISNCTWTTPTVIQGSMVFTTCTDFNVTDEIYIDAVSSTTVTTYAMYVWSLASATKNAIFSGLTLPVTNTHPYTSLINIGAAGCSNIKMRNIGTRSAPLNLGTANACGLVYILAAGAAASDLKFQRIYTYNTRTRIMTGDNSSTRVTEDNVYGDYANAADVGAVLNYSRRGHGGTLALTAQTAIYGTHWADYFITGTPANLAAVAWSRSTTTATITSTAHGLKTGDLINVTVTSDAAAIIIGQKSITVGTADTYTFTCLNAGAASGTLTFVPLNGRIAILANETTSLTSAQVALSGGAKFTAAGGLYMPSVNDQADFISPSNIIGHTGFPIIEPVMAGGTITNYNIYYSLDNGGSYKNLNYPRAGGGGSNGSTNVTMTDTTGVNVGDYVYGTNIAPLAKVQSITNGTTIVVTIANIGAVSGILRFSQLPNETVADASAGFPLRIRIKTATANATAITSLYFTTVSTSASRDFQYPLDSITLTLTGIVAGSDVVIYAAGTTTVRQSSDAIGGTTQTYTYSTTENVDIGVFKAGKIPFYIRNYALSASNASLPVAQSADRAYLD